MYWILPSIIRDSSGSDKKMILDKLLEKKDLKAYCNFRKMCLLKEMRKEIFKIEPKKRQLLKNLFIGRLKELDFLLGNINRIKTRSMIFCREGHKK